MQRVVNELLAGKGTAAKTPATPPGLRRGSTGTGVGRLQRGLNRVFPAYRNTVTVRRGHLLVLDEVYGPTVEAWVQEFQRRTRLPVTGVVDAATERKLATFGIKL